MQLRRLPISFKCIHLVVVEALVYIITLLTAIQVTAAWTNIWDRTDHQIPLISSPQQPVANILRPRAIAPGSHEFTLRHVFYQGTYQYPNLHRRLKIHANKTPLPRKLGDEFNDVGPYRAQSSSLSIQRLADRGIETIKSLSTAAHVHGIPRSLPTSAWTMDEIPGPDTEDRETVINLALMAANAYDELPGVGEWEDTGPSFNHSLGFGWEGDTLRGHVFADKTNSTIVIAIKGTSPQYLSDSSPTTTNDKINDNLFFGCCCGQGGQFMWSQVCDCCTTTYTCNETCVVQALRDKHRYHQASIELYGNITELYPGATVWLTGHSLGGAVSSLLGLTFGLPVVTYEAPPDALAASRLGLPSPPNTKVGVPQSRTNTGIWHFGHTADPVYMGSCNSAFSWCTMGGYSFESQCHLGKRCVYDTVKDKGWRASTRTGHPIRAVIRDVLRAYDTVARCDSEDEVCVDCFNWKRFESNSSVPTPTNTSLASRSTTTYTRTETCKTPGWWGCLDEETTTSGKTSSTFTTTSTTVTCTHYGWFGGCKSSFELGVL
jgi:lipase ATG15